MFRKFLVFWLSSRSSEAELIEIVFIMKGDMDHARYENRTDHYDIRLMKGTGSYVESRYGGIPIFPALLLGLRFPFGVARCGPRKDPVWSSGQRLVDLQENGRQI
jgi:hypothetical protein